MCARLAVTIDEMAAEDPADVIGSGATQADGDAATLTRLGGLSVVIDRLEAQRLRMLPPPNRPAVEPRRARKRLGVAAPGH